MLPLRGRRTQPRRRRLLHAFGAALVVLATIVAACSDELPVGPATPDSGPQPSTLGESVCPDAAPGPGERCVLPEGTTCAFGACGSPIAQCTLGAWRYSGNPQVGPSCPVDFPASETACPPCWPVGKECPYGSCSAPDPSPNTTVAACVDGGQGQPLRWSLRSFPCVTDAGADVQSDAEPDAD